MTTQDRKTTGSQITHYLVVVAVILVTYFFGITGINQDPIRRDESTTMAHIGAMERDGSGLTLPETWDSLLTYSGEHPPFYYSLANIWGHVVSYDYRIQRVLALFFGILAMATVYRLGSDIASSSVGLWAVVFLSTFTLYHHYLHEIREYSTLLFAASLVWLIYLRCVSTKRSLTLRHYLALGGATSMAMFSHPTAMFLFVAIGLFHLFFVPKDERWWKISVAVVIGGLTFSLWLPGLFSGVDTFNSRLIEGEDKTLFNPILIPQVATFFGNGNIIVFVFFLLVAIIPAIRNERGSVRIWFFVIIVALGYLALNSYFPFIKRIRYVLIFMLPYILLIGITIKFLSHWIRWQILPLTMLVIWIIVGTGFYRTSVFTDAVGTTAPQTFTEYHHLIPLLQENAGPNLAMVNTMYNLSTIKDSKQGKMGIDEYYREQLNINVYNIRWDIENSEATNGAIEFVSDKNEFWLNYFHTAVLAQVRDFREAVTTDFVVCQEIKYGERSLLVHYVAINQASTLCDT